MMNFCKHLELLSMFLPKKLEFFEFFLIFFRFYCSPSSNELGSRKALSGNETLLPSISDRLLHPSPCRRSRSSYPTNPIEQASPAFPLVVAARCFSVPGKHARKSAPPCTAPSMPAVASSSSPQTTPTGCRSSSAISSPATGCGSRRRTCPGERTRTCKPWGKARRRGSASSSGSPLGTPRGAAPARLPGRHPAI